jgi:phenylpropionate dioxygenase-like ring-hydroxylating dioxygenase large terminal subunit
LETTLPGWIDRYWLAAAPTSRLGSNPLPVRVGDRELVLFRDSAGTAHGLLDRCPHRGARLSLGRCEGDTLACGYHGWQFDGRGACTRIPSQPPERRIPGGSDIPAFPTTERSGYVWVWLSAEPPGQLPEISEFEAHRWVQGTVDMACSYERALENNLDWVHAPYTHRWTHGQFWTAWLWGLQEQRLEVVRTREALVVQGPLEARVRTRLHFEMPNRVTVLTEGTPTRRIVIQLVPTAAHRCRLEWMMVRMMPWGAKLQYTAKEPVIFRQDRLVLESLAELPHDRSVEADLPLLWLHKMLRAEQTAEEHEERRVISVRA